MARACVPGNTDAGERTLRVRERDTKEGTLCSRAIQTSQLATGSEQSRLPSLNPASCYSVVTTCGSDMNQINCFSHRYWSLSWILMTTLPVNLRESWREERERHNRCKDRETDVDDIDYS